MLLLCCLCGKLQQVVEPKAAVVRVEEARAQEKAAAARSIKDECESDLAEARAVHAVPWTGKGIRFHRNGADLPAHVHGLPNLPVRLSQF